MPATTILHHDLRPRSLKQLNQESFGDSNGLNSDLSMPVEHKFSGMSLTPPPPRQHPAFSFEEECFSDDPDYNPGANIRDLFDDQERFSPCASALDKSLEHPNPYRSAERRLDGILEPQPMSPVRPMRLNMTTSAYHSSSHFPGLTEYDHKLVSRVRVACQRSMDREPSTHELQYILHRLHKRGAFLETVFDEHDDPDYMPHRACLGLDKKVERDILNKLQMLGKKRTVYSGNVCWQLMNRGCCNVTEPCPYTDANGNACPYNLVSLQSGAAGKYIPPMKRVPAPRQCHREERVEY